MANQAQREWLSARRDAARRLTVIAVLLLFLFGFGYGYSSWLSVGSAGQLLPIEAAFILLAGILAFLAWSIGAWMFWGLRLRRLGDPWAYDHDLDGPGGPFDDRRPPPP